MTLNTYKIVGISHFRKDNDDGSIRDSYIAHCVSKDKIANEGYRVTSVFCSENNKCGDEVYIAYVDKRDRIINVK